MRYIHRLLTFLGIFKRVVVFDLETNGLLDTVSKVHCLVIWDCTNKELLACNDQERGSPTVADGLAILADPETLVVAHNGLGYDCRVLKKLFGVGIPWWRQIDTMVLSKVVWPELKVEDMDRFKKNPTTFPGQMIGRVSLESWGHRLGLHKGDYKGDPELVKQLMAEDEFCTEELAWKEAYARRWDSWNPAMEAYCIQDVRVTNALWALIQTKQVDPRVICTEMQVAHILQRQEAHGFLFDSEKAAKLYTKLVARKLELEEEVHKVFRPRYLKDGPVFLPKKDNKTHGYCEGASVTKVKLTDFNPSSRDHVSFWLTKEYGWEPKEFTPDGKPKVDDDVISQLPYAEAKPLKEYFMVCKRIGQVAEGNEAWLKRVKDDGRMRGRVDTHGTVTSRMTHYAPNMGQVPSGKSPYGHECRELFCVPIGYLLVGADADALELRDLAGYMAIYDGGAYIKTVLEGDKSQGTDMHSVNCRALGLDPKGKYFDGESGRDIAKTWFYAFIYGAGDEKLGYITTRKWGPGAVKQGRIDRASFLRNLPAMGKLVEEVKQRAKVNKFLKGLDGRRIPVRSQHAALNSLLQCAGAVQMKVGLCILDDYLQESGLVPGVDYEFVANVHDEWQIEVLEKHAKFVAEAAPKAIEAAGIHFNFRCPLAGNADIGRNWNETH